ncbi:Ig-like domain-containing protein [Brevibacillus ginsengisoli]|uniref:Ig-like domain-containing protein n=1 Tax=Brevibacillus ginsengisoli TaxID=363854 RepID=UPI003CEF5939
MFKKAAKSIMALLLLVTAACPTLVGAEEQGLPQQSQTVQVQAEQTPQGQAPAAQEQLITKPTIQVAAVDRISKKYRNGATALKSVEVTIQHEGAFTYSIDWVQDTPYGEPSHLEEKIESQTSQKPVTVTLEGNETGTPVKYHITATPEGKDESYQASFDIVVDLPDKGVEKKQALAVVAEEDMVNISTPAKDTTDVDLNTNVVLTIPNTAKLASSDPITPGSLSLLEMKITRDPDSQQKVDTPFQATLSSDGSKITLTPTVPLAGSTTYQVDFPEAKLLNPATKNLNKAFSSRFTTKSDVVPPDVTFTPANMKTGVDRTSKLFVSFSEPIYCVKEPNPLTPVSSNNINSLGLVQLLDSSGSQVQVSLDYDSNKNTISITPKNELFPGQNYKISVVGDLVQDFNGNKVAAAIATFQTAEDKTAPLGKLTNTIPVDLTSNLTIAFEELMYQAGEGANVPTPTSLASTYKLTYGSNQTVTSTASYDAATRTITIDPTQDLAPNTTYTLTLLPNQLKDIGGNVIGGQGQTFTFTTKADTVPPTTTISLTSSTQSPNVALDTNIDIDFNKNVTQQSNVVVTVKNNATNANITYTTTWPTANRKMRLDPTVDLDPNTSYTVTVPAGLVKDASGNPNGQTTLSFTTTATDSRAITQTFYPANNATNVSPDAVLSITFNKSITATTGTVMQGANPNTKFILRRSVDKVAVPTTLSYDAVQRKMSITPTVDLLSNFKYELVLQPSAVQDSLNNVNGADAVTFTTAMDIGNPTASYYPYNAQNNFPIDANLRITFNKNVYYSGSAITSVNAPNTFTLRDNSTGTIVSLLTATYYSTTRELTIHPTQNLKGNTSYTLSINSLVQDSAGRSVTPAAVTFTTAADTNQPTVFVNPSNNSSGVLLNSNITITFSKPVTLLTSSYPSYISIRDNVQNTNVAFTATWVPGTQSIVVDPISDLLPNRLYTVTVLPGLVKDNSNLLNATGYSYFYTQADSLPPSFTSIPSAGARNVSLTDNLSVTVSEPFTLYNGAEVTSQNVGTFVSLVDSRGKVVPTTATYNASTRTITIDPTPILRSNEDYRIVIDAYKIKDMAGNGNYSYSASFHTVYYGTLYVSADVTNGQTNVSTNRSFLISFSDYVYLANGTPLTNSNVGRLVKFTDDRGKNVPFTAAWDDDNLAITISPKVKLDSATRYDLKMDAGLVQNGGGAKNPALSVSFTTTLKEGDLPTVDSSPENGEEDVPLDTDIYLQFSEPILLANGSKLTNSNASSLVQLKESGGDAVSYQAEWDEGNAILTLKPTYALKKNESYTIYLPAGLVRDLSNNPVPAYTSNFYTSRDRNLVKVTTTPANGEKNVPLDKTLKVTFGDSVTLKNKDKITNYNLGTIIGLYDEDRKPVNVTFTWSDKDRTAQIKPAAPLKRGATYTLVVQGNSVFTSSKKTNAGTNVTFTTSQKTTPPTIKSNPKDGDKNVNIRQNIEITFGEKVTLTDGTDITNDNVASLVKLVDEDNKTVASKVTWNASTRKITLDPKLNLKKNKSYYIYLPAGVVSGVSGNLNENYAAKFKTANK